MSDPFTGGSHEKWDHPWNTLCTACKGYPQEHTRDEHCFFGPSSLEIGGIVIQTQRKQIADLLDASESDIARIDGSYTGPTSDPDCQED